MAVDMTQKALIKQHLESGKSITPLHAFYDYQCLRLASVIYDLKSEGMDIISHIVTDYNTGKRFSEYHLRLIKR